MDQLDRIIAERRAEDAQREKERLYRAECGIPEPKPDWMDPFEARVSFSRQLQNLNASVNSAQKAAAFALKHKDLNEDLHSCILEQLEKTAVNTRANIMYFLEHFLDAAKKDGDRAYIRMIQRDIIRVVEAVAPEDGSGAANIKIVRRVLKALRAKDYLDAQTVTQIEEVLKEREAANEGLSSPVNGDADHGGHTMAPSQLIPKSNSSAQLDKKQKEQRIEEDRERHKRLREEVWAAPPGGYEAEMWKMWEETSDMGEDDYLMFAEEAEERERCIAMDCPHREPYQPEKPANGRGHSNSQR